MEERHTADPWLAIEARLAEIERRLSALESAGPRPVPDSGDAFAPVFTPPTLREGSVSGAATHLGRVLLVFGGAYLLRAITDLGFLPTQAGIPLGSAYALFWLFMAYRAGASPGERVAAMLYGVVSVLLALPVLVEAVTRFELLSGTASAIALSVFCTVALTVAVVRNLWLTAWLTVAGGMLAAGVLVRASGTAVPFGVLLVVLGLASLWVVYLRRWLGLQWLGALGANLGVGLMAALSRHEGWAVDPTSVFGLAIALWCGYLLSFALASWQGRRQPGIFEAVQAVLASAVTLGVVLLAVQPGPGQVALLGGLGLLLGGGAYALAYRPAERAERGRAYYFFSTLGLALVICASTLLLGPSPAAMAWSLLAVILAWLSGRHGMVSLSLQSAVLLAAAAVGSDALAVSAAALVGDAAAGWPGPAPGQGLVAAAGVACLFLPVAQASPRWGAAAGLPQFITLTLSVWIVSGLVVALVAPVLAGVPGNTSDLGSLAALRTGVLAASAVALALSSRYRRWPEARWLPYPVIAAVGLKLVMEDFPNGRPVTLFLALALVGGALILVSKLLQRQQKASAGA